MNDPIPNQTDPTRDKEPITLESVCETIDTLATVSKASVMDEPGALSGRYHKMPEYEMYGSPLTLDTSISVAKLTKDGEEPIRLVYQLFYSSDPSTGRTDRGPVGYEIHSDGRVLAFTNAEVAGMEKDDDPDRYQERLEKVAAMLAQRERDLENPRPEQAPTAPRTLRERLGRVASLLTNR